MDWFWSMSGPMMLAEMAAIAVALLSLSLLAIPCCVNARHLLRMRFDPEYRRRREAITRHVADIAQACDELQAAYRKATVQKQRKPALRVHMPPSNGEQRERNWCGTGFRRLIPLEPEKDSKNGTRPSPRKTGKRGCGVVGVRPTRCYSDECKRAVRSDRHPPMRFRAETGVHASAHRAPHEEVKRIGHPRLRRGSAPSAGGRDAH